MPKFEAGSFHQVPDNVHKIFQSVYELAIFNYLLQCSDSSCKSFPSYSTLSQGLMSRYQAILTVKQLVKRGYVSIEKREFKSNIFVINIEKVINDVNQAMSLTGQVTRPGNQQRLPLLVNVLDPNQTYSNHIKRIIQMRNNGNKKHQEYEKKDPDRFIKGKFGHMVKR